MEGSERIYLDHHATTPVDRRVAAVLWDVLVSTFGNPNSTEHAFGAAARERIAEARIEVAALVGAESEGVRFTSGATEAIHLALSHARSARRGSAPLRVLASPVEHRAVLDALEAMEREGAARVRHLRVDRLGRIDLDDLRAGVAGGADLVCTMAANNEVGTVYPVEQISRIAAEHGASALIDATQAAGRVPLRADTWGITYLVLSAHKIYGPKGTGALVFGPGTDGRGVHAPGTPNVPGIAAMGEACRLRRLEMETDEPRIRSLRDQMERQLRGAISDLEVNGDPVNRLSGNLHVSVPGISGDAVLARLHDRVAISRGSACTSGADAPSHVLTAIGLDEERIEGALRIGLGKFTNDAEVDQASVLIAEAIEQVRAAMSSARINGIEHEQIRMGNQ